MDPRVVFWSIWAVGTVVVYAVLFVRKRRHYRQHPDPASLRDALQAFGLFLVALVAFFGITAALFLRGAGLAALLFAVSAGVFFVVGLYSAFERMPENGGHAARRQ
ncbi:MAG TPA: hypothetical protein VN773_09970 [Verrucomicrobiae bacterium]|nr:hypothetical protein [Verrucomicrobiae bacterium]